jgi:hypothetical protein
MSFPIGDSHFYEVPPGKQVSKVTVTFIINRLSSLTISYSQCKIGQTNRQAPHEKF